MKKNIIIIVLAICLSISLFFNFTHKTEEEKVQDIVDEYKQALVGKWLYGKSMEEMQQEVDKYNQNSTPYGTQESYIIEIDKDMNITQIIYYITYGFDKKESYIDKTTKKGVIVDGEIIFKEKISHNGNKTQIREVGSYVTHDLDTIEFLLGKTDYIYSKVR